MRIFVSLIVLSSLFALAGCQKPGTLKGLVQGRGKVEYQGKSVEEAVVYFHTTVPGSRSAFASTDANGNFILMTLKALDGVYPGEYNVTVEKKVVVNPPTLEEMAAYEEKYGHPMDLTYKDELPEKYATLETSDLKITIPKGGKKDIRLMLED